TLGAPAGASTPFGKSGVESFNVRPTLPLNGASGSGNTSGVAAFAARGTAAPASADAATREVVPSSSSRRFISTVLASLPELSSLIAVSRAPSKGDGIPRITRANFDGSDRGGNFARRVLGEIPLFSFPQGCANSVDIASGIRCSWGVRFRLQRI